MKLKNITLFSILIILFLSCNKVESPICIGFSGNLTEIGSDIGVSGLQGALLAVSDINSDGGINGTQLYLNIKNDRANSVVALEVDKELISEGCPIIVGHMISGVIEYVIPMINSSNYLLVSPTISTESLSRIDDNFIRLIPSNINQIKALSKLIINEEDNKFGILYESNNQLFANTFIDWLKAESNGKDVNKIFEFETGRSADYLGIINEIKYNNISQLLIISSGDTVAKFAQYFRKYDLNIQVFLPTWALTDSLIVKGGKTVEGFMGINFFNNENTSEEYTDFENKLLTEYNSIPAFSNIMAYEAVMLVADALKSTNSIDPETLRNYITKSSTYNGILGDLNIDKYGDATRSLEYYKIIDGEIRRIEP